MQKKTEKKVNDIIQGINSCGGFSNWRNWNKKQVIVWVMSNYSCSKTVAEYVATEII